MRIKETVDVDALIERVDGDMDLLADIAGIFLERSGEALTCIQRAIISQDAKALETAAHSLRGYLVSLHAGRASEIALQLEMKGRLDDCVGVRYMYSKLEEEIELLKPVLADCIATPINKCNATLASARRGRSNTTAV